jgi:hypothetical protein
MLVRIWSLEKREIGGCSTKTVSAAAAFCELNTRDLLDRLALDEVLAPHPRIVSTISILDQLIRYKAGSKIRPTQLRSSALIIGPGGAMTDAPALFVIWKGAGLLRCCRIVNQRLPKPGLLLIPRSRSSPVTVVEDMAKPRQGSAAHDTGRWSLASDGERQSGPVRRPMRQIRTVMRHDGQIKRLKLVRRMAAGKSICFKPD